MGGDSRGLLLGMLLVLMSLQMEGSKDMMSKTPHRLRPGAGHNPRGRDTWHCILVGGRFHLLRVCTGEVLEVSGGPSVAKSTVLVLWTVVFTRPG